MLSVTCNTAQKKLVNVKPKGSSLKPAQIEGSVTVTVISSTPPEVNGQSEVVGGVIKVFGDAQGVVLYKVTGDKNLDPTVTDEINDQIELTVTSETADSLGLEDGGVEAR